MNINVRRSNTILYCRKWSATVSFYREVLGFSPVMEREWFVEFRLNGGAYLSVADVDRATVPSAGGKGLTLSFRVDDVTTLRTQLAEQGVAPGKMRSVWGATAFYCTDPEGNRLEFWSSGTTT